MTRQETRPASRRTGQPAEIIGELGPRPRGAGQRHRLQRADPQQRGPGHRPAAAAGAGVLAAEVPGLVVRCSARRCRPGTCTCAPPPRSAGTAGPTGPGCRWSSYRWGIFLSEREPGPPDRVRPAPGRARLAGGARRVPQRPAAADRDPGRHRARLGGAAAAPGRDRAEPVRHAQPVPGQRRGGPPPVGDGVPAARLLRPGRPGGGRAAAQAQLRRRWTAPGSWARSTSRPPTGCRSSCSPTSPTGTASTSSAR